MSIYEGPLPQEEVDRLLANDYPLLISSRILDRLDLARRTLLDVGAGANPSLALFAHARGTQYQGMDKNPSMVIYVALDKANSNLGMARLQLKNIEANLKI